MTDSNDKSNISNEDEGAELGAAACSLSQFEEVKKAFIDEISDKKAEICAWRVLATDILRCFGESDVMVTDERCDAWRSEWSKLTGCKPEDYLRANNDDSRPRGQPLGRL